MKRYQEPWHKGWQLFLILIVGLLIICGLGAKSFGATISPFTTYVNQSADSAHSKVFSGVTGDSLAYGLMLPATNETEDNESGTSRWIDTLTITEYGPVIIVGNVFEGSAVSGFAYTIDLSPKAVLDTLQSQDDWIAHQSTSDSTYDSVVIIRDSILIVLDSLEALESWIAHQTTSDSLYDSLLIALDSLEALEAWVAHQTTADSVYDSLLIILDSLEALESWVAQQSEVVNLDGWTPFTTAQIADATWDEDTTGHGTASSFAVMLKDTSAYQGSAAGITAAEVSDSVWGKAFATVFGAGSMGDSLNNATYVQGSASGLSAKEVIDTLFNRLVSDTVNGSLLGQVIADLKSTLDSMQSQDGWVSHQTTADSIYDSLLIVLDSLENLEAWVANQTTSDSLYDSLLIVLDSLENLESWVANQSTSDSLYDSLTLMKDTIEAIHATALTTSDSLLIANRAEIAGQIEDSIHANAADYKSTGFVTPTDSVLLANRGEIAQEISDSTLVDSSSYQGSASGLSAAEVADTLAGRDSSLFPEGYWHKIANRADSGNASGGSCNGDGAYTRYILVLDTGAAVDSVVPNANVFVNNYAQSISGGPYEDVSNNNGIATFNLDAGSWVFFITEAGFATVLDSTTVSGTGTDTLKVYRDAGNMTTVAWQLDKPNGNPYANAKIYVNLGQAHPYDSILYVSDTALPASATRELLVTASDLGLASWNLYPNDSISGDSTWYDIEARDSRNNRIISKFNYRVPGADSTVWLQYVTRW